MSGAHSNDRYVVGLADATLPRRPRVPAAKRNANAVFVISRHSSSVSMDQSGQLQAGSERYCRPFLTQHTIFSPAILV